MAVKIEIDRASRRKMEETLEEFARVTGKTVEDGINDIARSVGRKLADRVQPWGLTAAKGQKFKESIGFQVDRAWFGTNLGAFPETRDMQQAHYNARTNGTRMGAVPQRQFRKEKGNPWLKLISKDERDAYKVKAQAKAGRAKAAWIEAANDIGSEKLSGIPDWIKRHVSEGWGEASKTGKGLDYTVTLHNRTPYMERILPEKTVAQTVVTGMKNGFTRIQKTIEKAIEKANRTT